MPTPRFITSMLALGIFLLACTSALSQEKSVSKRQMPAPVIEAFHAAYPAAKILGYSQEREKERTVYEIESIEGKVHRDVTYMADGGVVSIEETMPFENVPEAVRTAIAVRYPKAKILVSEKVTKGSALHYEFQLTIGKKKLEAVFDPDGSLVEEEMK